MDCLKLLRQRGDSTFAELLGRLRIKGKTESLLGYDKDLLKHCVREGPEQALHIFPTNNEVKAHNITMLMKLGSEIKILEAQDFGKNRASGKLVRKRVQFTDKTIGLSESILLAEGARVILLRNLDIQDGLVNGVIGTVIEISAYSVQELPEVVYIFFENQKVRKQYPLQLAWACTVHKEQGLTVDQCVVGVNKCFESGQAYVRLRRVKSLDGLYIKEIDDKTLNQIYCNKDICDAIATMPKYLSEIVESTDEGNDNLSIMYHTIQGLKNHAEDLRSNDEFKSADFICITETWLSDKNDTAKLDGFSFSHLSRSLAYDSSSELFQRLKNLQHGGVGLFYRPNSDNHLVNISDCNLESIAFVLKTINVVVCTVYRPQQYTLTAFMRKLENLVVSFEMLSSKVIVVGDFNQDLLKGWTSVNHLMASHGYTQFLSTESTEGGTLIDHVYVKDVQNV